MACAMASISSGVRAPICWVNLSRESERTWKASALLALVSPLAGVGLMCVCQKAWAKAGCQPVSGTITRRASLPAVATLTTTAGRFLRISSPREGSKFTCHTSPRCGSGKIGAAGVLPFPALDGGALKVRAFQTRLLPLPRVRRASIHAHLLENAWMLLDRRPAPANPNIAPPLCRSL